MTRGAQATSSDLKRWRKLVREAQRAAGDPRIAGGDLRGAAKAAFTSTVPSGALNIANPFVQLERLSRRYAVATAGQRREMGAELTTAAGLCGQLLDGDLSAAPSAAAQLPFRADIDG